MRDEEVLKDDINYQDYVCTECNSRHFIKCYRIRFVKEDSELLKKGKAEIIVTVCKNCGLEIE